VKKLILLARALNLSEFDPYRTAGLTIPVVLYHGRFDDVVDPDRVRAIAATAFSQLDYRLVDDDHALSRLFPDLPWDELLCGGHRD
jgi:pimeloyl-ACP methyl ester carboxylesterase